MQRSIQRAFSSNRGGRVHSWARSAGWRGLLRIGLFVLLLSGWAISLNRSAPTALALRGQVANTAMSPWQFDLAGWMVQALAQKGGDLFASATARSPQEEREMVIAYVKRSQQINRLTWRLEHSLAQGDGAVSDSARELQAELTQMRAEHESRRPEVERILQRQVAEELRAAGMGWGGLLFPPVLFTFVEPPKVLVLSPRERIANIYGLLIEPGIDPVQAAQREAQIRGETNLSAYVTNIGGLAAYPAMVVERGSLPWLIETVAHEWVHHYLFLFPLGLYYGQNPEVTIINESVADLVGKEIGDRVVRRHYPEFAPPEPTEEAGEAEEIDEADAAARPPARPEVVTDQALRHLADARLLRLCEDPPALCQTPGLAHPSDFYFRGFRAEMRETRLRVDAFLAAGLVTEAEIYMEQRRRYLAENGYPLRVLNQAYFAFHGSYASSAAQSSPIGPALRTLRAEVDDIPGFLRAVRWITTWAELEAILSEMGG